MSKITLSEGFSLIPEGTHVFKITDVKYKEAFGKLEIKMKTAKGQVHTERFSLLREDGSANEGALNAFSYFARAALGDFQAQDIEPEELVGCFVECTVEHDVQPSSKNPERSLTFVRLTDKRPAEGFGGEETVTSTPRGSADTKASAAKAAEIDLDELLG